jgi:hypothetical protein
MKRSGTIILGLVLLVSALYSQIGRYSPQELSGLNTANLIDSAQVKSKCKPKDIMDLFRKKDKPPPEPKQLSLLILPNISSNPVNGFLLGVGGNAAFFLGERENTRISMAGFSAAFTTEKQFLSFLKTYIFTKENKFFLQGDFRYYKYRAPTYGLGTNSPDTTKVATVWSWQGADVSETNGAYPMLYNYAIIHQIVNRKIVKNLYAGLGYHLDIYWDIRDEFLELDTIPVQLTPHYAYSEVYDFNSVDYMLSGLSLNFLYDSRDNQVNPYKGHYANVRYRYNPTFLGSDRNSSSLWVEYRTYIGLSKKTPRHLIGFWFIGSFILSGYQPYLTLMAIGEDKKARSGRGYIAGRYRGEDILYAEAEYRFPILCSGILGGVIFLNATTASNIASDVHLFEYVRPAIGAGLRFLINKNTRLNLNIDFGFGIDSRGFYFSGTETF